MTEEKLIAGRLLLEGVLDCITGLHIGGNKDVSEIGGIDLLVIRDSLSREPYIPGSSLKGKLRALLERYHYVQSPSFRFDRKMTVGGQEIRHHECGEQTCVVCRLFGASRGGEVRESLPARLYVRDSYLTPESKKELLQMESGYYLTEVKFENTLDRITSAANPRQIERVPRGTRFHCRLLYNLWQKKSKKEFEEDVQELFTGLRLLVDDYIGGHGSRGYGQVALKGIKLSWRNLLYYRGEAPEVTLEAEKEEDIGTFAGRVQEWVQNLQ